MRISHCGGVEMVLILETSHVCRAAAPIALQSLTEYNELIHVKILTSLFRCGPWDERRYMSRDLVHPWDLINQEASEWKIKMT